MAYSTERQTAFTTDTRDPATFGPRRAPAVESRHFYGSGRQGQPDGRDTALMVGPVLQRERSAMGLDDLARQNESDARALGLRRKERHEEIRALGKTGTLVLDEDDRRSVLPDPPGPDSSARDERGIHRVANDIDQHLFQLVTVGLDRHGLSRITADVETGFNVHH